MRHVCHVVYDMEYRSIEEVYNLAKRGDIVYQLPSFLGDDVQ